jgi:hypothetical protein
LYVAVGDGGEQNDFLENSQTVRKGLNSGLLRIDVDNRPGNLPPNPPSDISGLIISTNYSIPADNPFVTGAFAWERNTNVPPNSIRTEFWAVGLRNPWRFSIDPVTGWIWVGDVGGDVREEIDVVTAGGNYGWVYREGTVPGPVADPSDFTSIGPIYDYAHGFTETNRGNCVTGGFVYRGNRFRELVGAYVFSDFVTGYIWALRYDGSRVTDFHNLLQNGSPLVHSYIAAFGTDPRTGDILVAEFKDARFPSSNVPGRIWRLEALSPTLAINTGPTPGQYTLNWPGSPDAFDLYSAPDLSEPSSWSSVGKTPILVNARWTVTVDATNQSQFFRLQSR